MKLLVTEEASGTRNRIAARLESSGTVLVAMETEDWRELTNGARCSALNIRLYEVPGKRIELDSDEGRRQVLIREGRLHPARETGPIPEDIMRPGPPAPGALRALRWTRGHGR